MNEQTVELAKRAARFFADRLEEKHPEVVPTRRLNMAFECATNLVLRAKWSGTWDLLVRNLDRLQSETTRFRLKRILVPHLVPRYPRPSEQSSIDSKRAEVQKREKTAYLQGFRRVKWCPGPDLNRKPID